MSTQKIQSGRLYYVVDESDTPRATILNHNTAAAVAAATCGANLIRRGYIDTIEVVHGKPKRQTKFCLDANRKLNFKPEFEEEDLDVAEVIRRFNDRKWCEKNPNHPIAFLHFFADNFRRFVEIAKDRKPGKLIRRGNRFVIIDDGCPREVEQQFLKDLENGI